MFYNFKALSCGFRSALKISLKEKVISNKGRLVLFTYSFIYLVCYFQKYKTRPPYCITPGHCPYLYYSPWEWCPSGVNKI